MVKAITRDRALVLVDKFIDFAAAVAAETDFALDDYAVELLKFARKNDSIMDWIFDRVGAVPAEPGAFSIVVMPEAVTEQFAIGGFGEAARNRFMQWILPMLLEALKSWLADQGFPLPLVEGEEEPDPQELPE